MLLRAPSRAKHVFFSSISESLPLALQCCSSPLRFEHSSRSLGLLSSVIFLLSASNIEPRTLPQSPEERPAAVTRGEKVSVGADRAAEEGRLVAGTFHRGHDESMKCESAEHCCSGGSPDVSWASP